MRVWTFFDFIDGNGVNSFQSWVDSQPRYFDAHIDARLLAMEARQSHEWPPKWISALKGHDNIYELRIPWKNVQYRPLCCYGPDLREITLLVGAIEKNDQIPLGLFRTAAERRILILNDRRFVRERQLPRP